MTTIEKFNYTHIPHDYILFKENGDIFATISSTEAELEKIVKEVYNSRKSIYKFLGCDMPKSIIAHQTYTDKEIIFNF